MTGTAGVFEGFLVAGPILRYPGKAPVLGP